MAVRVYPMPALLIDRLLNIAIPLTAATVSVPLSVPLPGLAAMEIVTNESSVVTTLPDAVSTDTWIAGLIETPATVLVGSTVKTTWLATEAEVMLNVVEVPVVRIPSAAVRVYPTPVLLIDRLLNVAIPFTALIDKLPPREPPPGFVPIATVTLDVSVVTTFPNASSTAAWTAG